MSKQIKIINSAENRNLALLEGGFQGHFFDSTISIENLFLAWKKFKKGKSRKKDVQEFQYNLEDNILQLHEDLKNGFYDHGRYLSFYVNDPKPRHIHKASVRDRVLHHALVRVIGPIFDTRFIYDSYSCRIGKGTHRAIDRFQKFTWKISQNNTRTVHVLKCDIKKFFDNIDQGILLKILKEKIPELKLYYLFKQVIESFKTSPGKGLPLGNITSQILANLYLNEFDQFIKRELRVKNYIRYGDDFLLLDTDYNYLYNIIDLLRQFLGAKFKLELHNRKVKIIKYHKGVDFLGYIQFPHFRILRTKTKRRIFRNMINIRSKIGQPAFKNSFASYLGVLSHCRSLSIRRKLIFKVFQHA